VQKAEDKRRIRKEKEEKEDETKANNTTIAKPKLIFLIANP
jgi:hypothetical protein